jgi:hypothetical protein
MQRILFSEVGCCNIAIALIDRVVSVNRSFTPVSDFGNTGPLTLSEEMSHNRPCRAFVYSTAGLSCGDRWGEIFRGGAGRYAFRNEDEKQFELD